MNSAKRLIAVVTAGVVVGGVVAPGQTRRPTPEHMARVMQQRDEETQPERLMERIGLRPGMKVGEAGAGGGYLTFHLARKVGPEGHVYANDINSRALGVLKERQGEQGLANITAVLGETSDPLFPNQDLDMIVAMYAYHEFEDKVAWLKNARKYLKPGAPIVILDYVDDQERIIPAGDVENEGRQAGLELTLFEKFVPRLRIFVLRAAEPQEGSPKKSSDPK